MPCGTEIYNLDTSQIAARGLIYTHAELNDALAGPVVENAFDDEGTAVLESLLSSLAETDFENREIKRILSAKCEPESWRVGEALAESYLTAHRNCTFPWPNIRDQKKRSSSLPGTDLVGFHIITAGDNRFAFGEVKTSDQEKYPPSVMYGRHGLKQQLEDLCDNVDTRDSLVKYLGHHTPGSTWEPQFRNATKRYLSDNKDVSIFGVMVRDVKPHEDDLRARAGKLGNIGSHVMIIELLAIYLPIASIETLGSRLAAIRKGGDEW
jgi:hypothetical protein